MLREMMRDTMGRVIVIGTALVIAFAIFAVVDTYRANVACTMQGKHMVGTGHFVTLLTPVQSGKITVLIPTQIQQVECR
jgi:hypothetical protein